MIKSYVHVCATWSEQGRVQSLLVVSRHEEDLALLRSNSIQCVEEATEAEFLLLNLVSLDEHRINVFKEDDRVFGSLREESVQSIIIKLRAREIQVAKVKLLGACNGLDE